MHWTDNAIVLSTRKHGETSAVVRVFSRGHGVYGGIVRGANSKNNRGIIQPGNVVNATWNARLSEQLGTFKCELLTPHAALIMQDAAKLAALSSACSLMEVALPERHPYTRLYDVFLRFLNDLQAMGNEQPATPWQEAYVLLELDILAETGFGLDLRTCAATGTTEDLIYVSPKSGRAVSREAGEPYKDKLLAVPGFLLGSPLGGGIALPLGESGREQAEDEGRAVRGTLREYSRKLRKESTKQERLLWQHLSNRQFDEHKFRRQHPIGNSYIADFICLERKLIIELDGGQHVEQQTYDAERTVFLEKEGYRVLRFWNNDVTGNMAGVLESISEALKNTPHASSGAQERLLSAALPQRESKEKGEETLAGLRLTGYFLDHWLLSPHKRKLPAARGRLIEMMKKHGTEATKT